MEQLKDEILVKDKKNAIRQIVVYNDNNTFIHVINSLIEVCGHDQLQAEQCAWIIHNNSKCDVKSGDFETLKPYYEKLVARKLSAKIE